MATVEHPSRDFEFSKDELLMLAESLKDERFRGVLGYLAGVNGEPNNQKHYEREVKKWEKQNGVDVVFVEPSPGFVVVLWGGMADGDPVCVNICTSEAVQEPSFVRATQGTSSGHRWSIPHAFTKSRKESVFGEKQLLRELLRGRGGKRSNSRKQLKEVYVHDVVFHPDTLHLAASNHAMKQSVIETAMESLSENHQLKTPSPKEISSVRYVGKPVKCMIRKVIDKALHAQSGKLSFLNKAEDERTSADAGTREKKAENQSTNALSSDVDSSLFVTPKYFMKHVNKVDLQDYAIQLIPQTGNAWRPQALEVVVQLPGVSRATQVEAEVIQQSVSLSTSSTPKYKLDLPLPYAVDEETSTATFDVSTQKLTFMLAVMPLSTKDQIPLPSPSSDSGIECEAGYRTNSDGDNSSEVSVSSQEECPRDEEDEENSVFESAPSSPVKTASLIPSYTLKQTEGDLRVVLDCGNVLSSSVSIKQSGKQAVNVSLASIGGGQVQLNYGIAFVCNHDIANCGVSHQVNNDNVEIVIKKAKPAPWDTCQIGYGNCLATVNVPKMEGENKVSQPTKVDLPKHGYEENASQQKKNITDGMASRKPRVTRAVSMCEENAFPTLRLKGPTCSWPKGILKRRSRSLSESQLGSVLPFESLMALESPLEIELPQEDKDDEESVEEGGMLSSSLLGEKKSVRFNDVVSRQLFRSNSSILGQRAKNQRKALKKQRCQERHASDSDASQCHSDPGTPSSGDLASTTTTDDDDTEVDENLNRSQAVKMAASSSSPDAFIDVDLDVENNNHEHPVNQNGGNSRENNANDTKNNNNNNNSHTNDDENDEDDDDFIVKTSKKKRKNNKKKNKNKKFEPSNNFIFQLDIEP